MPRRRNQSSSGYVTNGGIAANTASTAAHQGQRKRIAATRETKKYTRNAAPCRRPNNQTPSSVRSSTCLSNMPMSSPVQVNASNLAAAVNTCPICKWSESWSLVQGKGTSAQSAMPMPPRACHGPGLMEASCSTLQPRANYADPP